MSIGNLKDTGNQGNNLPYQWKVLQGLQAILDEVSQPLTCVEDSIAICDPDGDTLDIQGDGSINVNVLQSIGVYEEDMEHFNKAYGSFILAVRNDTNMVMTSNDRDYSPISVNSKGAVAIQDGGNSITVDALNLDIRDLTHLTDTIKIYGSNNANPVFTDIAGNIGITDNNGSITVDGGTGLLRTPTFLRPTGSNGSVALGTYSMSFASVGTGNAIVGTGAGTIILKPGETLNFDAGAINNTLGAVTYDTTTNAGAELIIITLT